jgi:hypothetical protein
MGIVTLIAEALARIKPTEPFRSAEQAAGNLVYFQQNKKGEGQGKERCHAKSMMSNEARKRLKRYTQRVSWKQH